MIPVLYRAARQVSHLRSGRDVALFLKLSSGRFRNIKPTYTPSPHEQPALTDSQPVYLLKPTRVAATSDNMLAPATPWTRQDLLALLQLVTMFFLPMMYFIISQLWHCLKNSQGK